MSVDYMLNHWFHGNFLKASLSRGFFFGASSSSSYQWMGNVLSSAL